MQRIIESLIDMLVKSGIKIIVAVIVLTIGFKISKMIVKAIKKGKKFNKIDKNVQTFTLSFVSIVSKALVILIVASIVGIPTTSLITVVGSAGVAIGLALQGGLSNIAGGIMILLFKPFEVGDYVDTCDGSGTVSSISMFYTELITPDNKRIMVPNGELSNKPITNYSSLEIRRVDLKFQTSYDNDIDKVKKVITDVCSDYELIDKEQEIFVRVSDYENSAITYTVRVWTSKDDYWTVYFDLTELIKKAFDKNKIEIPFNQLDVHVKK